MSTIINKFNKVCYHKYVKKTKLSEWFEQKYLEWQLSHGRRPLDDYAEFLGISRGYLSQLMIGSRTNIGKSTAIMICERLNNYQLLDILGYLRPDHAPPDNFPAFITATWKYIPKDKRQKMLEIWRDALIESEADQRLVEKINQFAEANGDAT